MLVDGRKCFVDASEADKPASLNSASIWLAAGENCSIIIFGHDREACSRSESRSAVTTTMERSIFKSYVTTRPGYYARIPIIQPLCTGFALSIIEAKSKVERKRFVVHLELCRIEWFRPMPGVEDFDGFIDFRDIKEIRQQSNELAILYGKKFCLKKLHCRADNTVDPQSVNEVFNYIKDMASWAPFRAQIDIMLHREFEEISSQENDLKVVYMKDMKHFVARHHFKQSTEQLKRLFYEVDTTFSRHLDFDGFVTFYYRLSGTFEMESLFARYLSNKRITAEQLQEFFLEEQKDDLDVEQVSAIIERSSLDSMRHYETVSYFTSTEFFDYLFSHENCIWNYERTSQVWQDMTQPLSHYWIASSHNTYLTGDQFRSESSVECYIRCLRSGCRCVELDTWDGNDGKPIIYHGHTLTTKISFCEVIKCIRDHAFETSPYPVILSIENHCSVKQQKVMANYLENILGDLLLKRPIDDKECRLPSPEQLKGKIILKHKKIKLNVECANSKSKELVKSGSKDKPGSKKEKSIETDADCELSKSLKAGDLHILDPSDNSWKKYLVFLYHNRLSYLSQKAEDEEKAEEDEDEDNQTSYGEVGRKPNYYAAYKDESNANNELHYGEIWFHGLIERNESVAILYKHSALGDGTFLVRESKNNIGDYTLSFLKGNDVHHSHIKLSYSENGLKKYRLNDMNSFNTLLELIDHYRTHPLKSEKFSELYLRHPAPPANTHEDEPWFYKNMTRKDAEDILRRLRHEGAFLVRPSEKEENQFSISFRAESKIKHCRIKREGRLYFIGNEDFSSLTALIEFYQNHPLYKKINLRFPATQESVRILGGEPADTADSSYMDPNSTAVEIKAIVRYDYIPKASNELTLKVGDTIRNIIKFDNGWWQGDLEQQKAGFFPYNCVDEIVDDDVEKEDEEEPKPRSIDLDNEYISVSMGPDCTFYIGVFNFKAASEEDQEEWINKIREVINANRDKSDGTPSDWEKEQKSTTIKVAPELNRLVHYCIATAYRGRMTNFREMCSFRESKMRRLLESAQYRDILQFSREQLIRVYPEGSRINSSNYHPMHMWNCGAQLVALNYQTKDKPMQLNHAKFQENGNCGYVLMPDYMRSEHFDAHERPTEMEPFSPVVLTVKVICAKNLQKNTKGILSPSVEVEVLGTPFDSKKYLTKVVYENGLCPSWSNEKFVFNLTYPELCLLRFVIYHRDTFDEKSLVGQATFPVSCIRQGFRSIRMNNEYTESSELSTLLVHIHIQSFKDESEEKLNSSIKMLSNLEENINQMLRRNLSLNKE